MRPHTRVTETTTGHGQRIGTIADERRKLKGASASHAVEKSKRHVGTRFTTEGFSDLTSSSSPGK